MSSLSEESDANEIVDYGIDAEGSQIFRVSGAELRQAVRILSSVHEDLSLMESQRIALQKEREELDGLKAKIDADAATMTNSLKLFKEKMAKWEEMNRRYAKDIPSSDTIITLNVGGSSFSTKLGTLTSSADSYFAVMFSGRSEIPQRTSDGYHVFIDRDPIPFEWILAFLRSQDANKVVSMLSTPQIRSLAEEADFFGLDILVNACQFAIEATTSKIPEESKKKRKANTQPLPPIPPFFPMGGPMAPPMGGPFGFPLPPPMGGPFGTPPAFMGGPMGPPTV